MRTTAMLTDVIDDPVASLCVMQGQWKHATQMAADICWFFHAFLRVGMVKQLCTSIKKSLPRLELTRDVIGGSNFISVWVCW